MIVFIDLNYRVPRNGKVLLQHLLVFIFDGKKKDLIGAVPYRAFISILRYVMNIETGHPVS
jgi:hypothetical protein